MKQRLIAISIFISYSAVLVKVLVFKDLPFIRIGSMILNFGGSHEGPANLVPFKTILPYLLGKKGLIIAGINLIGNTVLLVPIGFLVPFFFPDIIWKKVFILAVATGFFIEGMQVLLHVGIFDIDDILLNGLGVVIGYWLFTIFANASIPVKRTTLIFTAIVLIVIAAALSFYGVDVYQQHRLPERFEPVAGNGLADIIDSGKVSITHGMDPCRGTGGTGQIVSVENNSITVKRHNGTNLVINFTTRTAIRNAAGVVSKTDLKIGDSVTVVVDLNAEGTGVVTTVLVCNDANPQPAK